MKKRPDRFLSYDEIDHNSEIFSYIQELHKYLWRVIRAVTPGASGIIDNHIDRAIDTLEANAPEVKALVDAAQAVVEGALKEMVTAGCYCGACSRRARLAEALEPFTVPR